MDQAAAGLSVTVAQVAYAVGLLCITPLGDKLERRRMAVVLMLLAYFDLRGRALSPALAEARLQALQGRQAVLVEVDAIALGEDQGMIKTIFDKKTGELIGAHMVGTEVTELIQGFVVAMNLETTEEELMHTIFPHPTLSEMMKESVLDAYGRVLNA